MKPRWNSASSATLQRLARQWHCERHVERNSSEIPGPANLIPQAFQFVTGIPHHNDGQDKALLWDVVRSIASTKMHYLPLISKFLEEPLAGLERLKFADAFPNLPPPFVRAGGPY